MDRQELQRRLIETFLDELNEHTRALDRDLLALERRAGQPTPELLESLFRTVHTLKGASRSVGAPAIEEACHRLESTLADLRDGRAVLDAERVQLLFTTIDALKEAGKQLRAQHARDTSVRSAGVTAVTWPSPTAGLEGKLDETSAAREPPGDVVRVSLHKLDALLARSSELLVARHRAGDALQDVARLRDALRRSRSDWRLVERPLRAWWISRNGRVSSTGTQPPPALPRRAAEVLERFGETLKRLEQQSEQVLSRLTLDHHGLEQAATALEEELLHTRVVAFDEVAVGLERAVRDLARAASKEIDVVVEGAGVEVGRGVLDRLKDPLLHLLRNAVDHGVEAPDERQAAGKPRRGTITVSAMLRGNTVTIVVADDGRGVDMAAVREQARRQRMTVPEDDHEAIRLLFVPGFSTARSVTDVSGRGVGLDIVKHTVESLHGYVELSSTAGQGTCVSLTVPLQVATVRALLLTAARQTFALPLSNLVRLMRVEPHELGSAAGRDVLLTDNPPIPVVSLAGVLGIDEEQPEEKTGKLALVVVQSGSRQAALIVDALLEERELVVKNLGPRLAGLRHVAGGAVLPTGRIALILNAAELVERALSLPLRPGVTAIRKTGVERRRRLLLAEDSVTTRCLEKSILEAAGYEVMTAVDGADAWRRLQEEGADLVVADVEMPHMDGFTLCEAIRGSRRFRDLPVVLVTAHETENDKARGLEAGANAYLPKSTFDQRQLLEVIGRLL